jgi:hypothetical protein
MIPQRLAFMAISPALSLVILGCHGSKPDIESAEKDRGSIACSAGTEYFPPITENGTGGLFFGADQAEWETNYLRHMNERSLYACGQANAEPEYRFLWDRSLSEPISVRLVVHANGSGTLFARELKHGGLLPPVPPGKKGKTWDEWLIVKLDQQTEVTPDQVERARSLFNQIDFGRYVAGPEGLTTDGSDWIYESRVSGRYRLIDFRNKPSNVAKQAGFFMVFDLAKISIPSNAVY